MILLELRGIDVSYGDLPALRDVSLTVEAGEILSVVGANGAGKTTMLRTISGLMRPRSGEIFLEDVRTDRLPCHAVVERGVVQVPEGRKIFPSLTVLENLELGSYTARAKAQRRQSLERVYTLFPILGERRRQAAGTLSGGQQQMLAIGRALMALPRILMLDEPSLGLAPLDRPGDLRDHRRDQSRRHHGLARRAEHAAGPRPGPARLRPREWARGARGPRPGTARQRTRPPRVLGL